MIGKFKKAGDEDSAAVLEIIYRDEIGHVAIGKRWFDWVATRHALEPKAAWQDLVQRYFHGSLKGPL